MTRINRARRFVHQKSEEVAPITIFVDESPGSAGNVITTI
jgi:hypothetical protein